MTDEPDLVTWQLDNDERKIAGMDIFVSPTRRVLAELAADSGDEAVQWLAKLEAGIR